jgi:hypothetical protein
MIHQGSQVHHTNGALAEVQYVIPPFPDPRVPFREGYVRVAVKVLKPKGPYKEGDWVIWDVKDHASPTRA